MSGRPRSVLVTGASSGIGAALVERLARAGWRVYASVRKAEDEDRLLAHKTGDVVPVRLDVRDTAQIEAVAGRIEADLGAAGLDALVNNAGIAIAGPLEFLPIEELRDQLEVNLIGQIAVTQAMLGALRKASGRIVFVGSIAGRSAMPITGAYSASKFALEAAADALRIELRPWSINVIVVEPGAFATTIWQTSRQRANQTMEGLSPKVATYYGDVLRAVRRVARHGERSDPPDAVVTAMEDALNARRPRARYIVGGDARLRLFIERILPTRWRDALVANRLKRLGREGE